jgi:hypothetical protein
LQNTLSHLTGFLGMTEPEPSDFTHIASLDPLLHLLSPGLVAIAQGP